MGEDNLNLTGMGDDGADNPAADQTAKPAWTAQLPDDLKGNEFLTQIPSIGELGKKVLDYHGKVENAVQLPGENASDEERATFYNKLGRPEKPEDYQFEGIEWPNVEDPLMATIKDAADRDLEDYRKVFHEIGLTAEQAKALHKKSFEMALARYEQAEKASTEMQEKVVASLKTEWGNDFDGNLTLAKRAFNKVGELAGVKDEFAKFMDDSKLGNNPLFVKVFHAMGKAMSDDTALDTDGTPGGVSDKDVPRGPDGRPRLHFPSMET